MFATSCGGDDFNGPNKTNAEIEVQFYVQSKLKSPGSSEFGTADVSQISDSIFIVESYVDAQNGFGANIRTYYIATIEYLPKGKLKFSDLTFY